MRAIFLFIFILGLNGLQTVYAQDLLLIPVDLEVKALPVRQVLKELKNNYAISFAYSRDKLSLNDPVTLSFSNQPLVKVLDAVFEDAKITYKVIGQQIILRKENRPVEKLSSILKKPITTPKKGISTQSIRGIVSDQDSGQPLVGASVWVEENGNLQGVITDLKGHFFIGEIPVGRHSIQVSYLGYQATQIRNIHLIAGKEMVLKVSLTERTTKLNEVVIRTKPEHARPINEMAVASARSFSVEETSRYAASFQDPARMVTNYAGVSSGTNDPTDNTISVRGNSPTTNLWRLEGVDIPNPNHYATLGSGGGAISMLSGNMLAPSDFYTGAFPADFGNALGGIFDLKLRKGNSQTREYSLSIGSLGLEASAEGPLKKLGPEASYLINYRFSTLALLRKFGVYPAGKDVQPPIFQDVSFKVHVPTKPGNSISFFGLGGVNNNLKSPDLTSLVDTNNVELGWRENGRLGIFGITHQMTLSKTSFLRSSAAFSHWDYADDRFYYKVINNDGPSVQFNSDYLETINNNRFVISSIYTKKLNVRSTIRFGLTYNHRFFGYQYLESPNDTQSPSRGKLEARGYMDILQMQAQWKHRWNNNLTLNVGLHGVYFGINQSNSIEPRLSLSWEPHPRHRFTASASRHSKLLHEAYYFVKGTDSGGNNVEGNQNLDVIKSVHTGVGWNFKLGKNTYFKTEAYYQYLYNVPVAESNISVLTQVNSSSVWNLIGPQQWINLGTARNYGLEWTFEKQFSRNYYVLSNLSLFHSRFSNDRITQLPTRFDQALNFNLATGKEFKFGYNERNILGINFRLVIQGGQPYTPIDLDASINAGRAVYDINNPFSERLAAVRRLDTGLKLQLNRNKITHTFQFDIQNTTLTLRERNIYYDPVAETVVVEKGLSILPVILYRFDF